MGHTAMTKTPLRRARGARGIVGAALGGTLALLLATPTFALEMPTEPAEAATMSARSGETSFVQDLQTEIHIGDEVRPTSFESSPDGTTGYVVSEDDGDFVFIDMASRTITERLPLESRGADFIRVTADGTRAVVALTDWPKPDGVGVIDLVNREVVGRFADVPDSIQEFAVPRDGMSFYALGLDGTIEHFAMDTGNILGSRTLPGMNFHSLLLIENDTKLLVGYDNQIFTLDATTFEELAVTTMEGVSSIGKLRVDQSDERVYFSDNSGSRLGVMNPQTGEKISIVKVGNLMHQVTGVDRLNRAFGNVPYWDLIMSADFTTEERSESFRATPTAPFSMSKNPVTGELLSANGGWSNAEKGSTVTIVNTPSVTDPEDVSVTTPGEIVRFETNAVGIKRGNGGGIIWQSSADGETWTDIEGATDEQIDVEVTSESIALEYRVRWADDFWGDRGASAAARIVAPAPQITFEGPLADGTVGTAYPATVITATGLEDLSWSLGDETDAAERNAAVHGLPAGMTLDADSGELSGTPNAAGEYTFTVRVTDSFGADEQSYSLLVRQAGEPGGPTDPSDPKDPSDPNGPQDPNGTKDPEGQDGSQQPGELSHTGAAAPITLGAVAAAIILAGLVALGAARRRTV